jgi:endonuclease/exonuclease/phosphatase family metal-dependent hydrolase
MIQRLCPILLVAILLVGCQPEKPESLRILAYNIHHAEGMDEVTDLERIAWLIDTVRPDIVALQEVDSVVTRTGGVDQAAELARMTGMQPYFGRFMDYQGGAYGMALLSNLPVATWTNVRLPDGDEPRTVVAAEVELATGPTVRVIGVHFYRTESERLAQAKALEAWLADQEPMPTLLAGDFNSYRGDSVLTHLEQTWHVVDKGEDFQTFPSWAPDREIDYFMWQPVDAFDVVSQDLLDEPVKSDHRPLVIEVQVTDHRR